MKKPNELLKLMCVLAVLLGLSLPVYGAAGNIVIFNCADFGETDADGDGFSVNGTVCSPPDDCNEADASVYPGAPEICGDGIDQDCDGADEACPPSPPSGGGGGGGGGWQPAGEGGGRVSTFLVVKTDPVIILDANQEANIPVVVSYEGAMTSSKSVVKDISLNVAGLPAGSYKIVEPAEKDINYREEKIWTIVVNIATPLYQTVRVTADGVEDVPPASSRFIEGEDTFTLRVMAKEEPEPAKPVQPPRPAPQLPVAPPPAAEPACLLFGMDFGIFIICWYWWLILFLVLLALITYFVLQDIKKAYPMQKNLKKDEAKPLKEPGLAAKRAAAGAQPRLIKK